MKSRELKPITLKKSKTKKKKKSSETSKYEAALSRALRSWKQSTNIWTLVACIFVIGIFIYFIITSGSDSIANGGNLRSNQNQAFEDSLDDESAPIADSQQSQSNLAFDIERANDELSKPTGKTNPLETPIQFGNYNVLLSPLQARNRDIWCPENGGAQNNKICSKAFVEYLFNVPQSGKYYLYVETNAPTILDNSLWIGSPNLEDVNQCSSSTKAGPLVPHKHVKSKKWLCCPKYLEKNARKGMAAFYSDCCSSEIGPHGNDVGCILDLEVDSKPHWNMFPRVFKITNPNTPVAIRLYAREDGTGITRVMLSSKPDIESI